MSTDDLITWLRAQLDEDERRARVDDRHWSEVPDILFSRSHMLDRIAGDRLILNFLTNASQPAWATYAVAEEARHVIRLFAIRYAGRDGYQEGWRP